jgi:WD40 repeat protein
VATLAGHGSSVTAVAFSPASSDATARLWDVVSGAHLATLVPLSSGGYITLLPDASYKLDGDPGDCLWWAVGLRRLGAAEAGRRFPEVRRLAPDAPILPSSVG